MEKPAPLTSFPSTPKGGIKDNTCFIHPLKQTHTLSKYMIFHRLKIHLPPHPFSSLPTRDATSTSFTRDSEEPDLTSLPTVSIFLSHALNPHPVDLT